jgi:sugar phosphate isomerase/epimerase
MKIGCIPLNFGAQIRRDKTMTNEDWFRMAVELGLDSSEVYEPFVRDLDEAGKVKLAGVMRGLGLLASSYTIECDFSRPERRQETTAHVHRSVDNAIIFGAKIVRVVAAAPNDRADREWVLNSPKEAIIKSCADGLRGCLDYAEKKKVMLALEDHWLIGTNVPDFMRILELVNDNRMKVNLDMANVPRDTTVQLAKLVGNRVVHTHVSELLEGKHGIVIGKGDVDFKGVFRTLKEFGYDSWISLEALTGDKEDLKFSINHIRKVWASA